MPRTKYKDKNFRAESLALITQAIEIINEYTEAGYKLTLRQLYYQFVARDLIPNTIQSYSKIGGLINDARLAGLIDWNAIEDRTRNVQSVSHWREPSEIVDTAARQFRIDKWEDQEYRVEVWIEKEALAGVVEPVCQRLDIPFLSCRGYTSQSEMWAAGVRLLEYYEDDGQKPIIIHLGDHDPSGIDMTRDIDDRLSMFAAGTVEIKRIALNYDQIEEFKPPPNPAKMTDSRFKMYAARFGTKSWELDAIDPKNLGALIEKHVLEYRDEEAWDNSVKIEEEYRAKLREAAKNYNWG